MLYTNDKVDITLSIVLKSRYTIFFFVRSCQLLQLNMTPFTSFLWGLLFPAINRINLDSHFNVQTQNSIHRDIKFITST